MKTSDFYNKIEKDLEDYNKNKHVGLESNTWATLMFDIEKFTKEERKHLDLAFVHLTKAGIRFDRNAGRGFITWELDWSLDKAKVQARHLKCMNCQKTLDKKIWWYLFKSKTKDVTRRRCLCSKRCADKYAKSSDSEIVNMLGTERSGGFNNIE